MTLVWWILVLSLWQTAAAQVNDDDLMSFITRPEIRAPKFDVKYHDRRLVSPGYWFVAPYTVLEPEPPTKKWMPCQVGPHIYDADGTLIWSGSCLFENRNTFDFKAVNHIDDKTHLSFIVQHAFDNNADQKGGGLILDGRYEYENVVPVTNDVGAFDIHEFNVLPGGKTALATAYRAMVLDFADLGRPDEQGWVMTGGFEEIDVATGDVLFDWRTIDHIPLSESTSAWPEGPLPDAPGWDYIHVNSVDKNADGDYLLSARFTDTIYLISHEDGHIIWRLGGKSSDFELDNFRFYRQHHARFLSHNETHTTISFLNNASDEESEDDIRSSVLIVSLDTTTKRASVVARYGRPDGGLSRLRGNAQTLPNGNIFAGWSQQGYHSEFTPDGTCVMEARFTSPRFSTYRSYKFEFHGRPTEPPALKAFVYGARDSDLSTVYYVSWNGATDVASWNFYAQADPASPPVLVGNVPKAGFETMFVADGYMNWVSAEALDADGKLLGMSDVMQSVIPPDWLAAGFHPDSNSDSGRKLPEPADPAVVVGALQAEDDAKAHEKVEEEARQYAKAYEVLGGIGGLLVFMSVICSLGGVLAAAGWMIRRRRAHYVEVPSEEAPRG